MSLRTAGAAAGGRPARLRAVGLAIVIALVVITIVGTFRPNPFHRAQVVRAVFDEAIGFAPVDDDVRVAGVNVGHVGDIRRVGQDAEVELLIDEDIGGVYRDARASLRPHHPFEGASFVDLVPGSPSAGELGDRAIPRARTRVYVTLDQATRVLDEDTRRSLQVLLDELAASLGPRARMGLGRALDNAPRLVSDLRKGARVAQGTDGEELQGAIAGLSQTVDALAGESDDVPVALRGARRTLAAVDVDAGQPLDGTLVELPPTLLELDRGSRSLTALLSEFDPLSADLALVLEELEPTVRELRPLVERSTPVLRRMRPLLVDLGAGLDNTADAVPAQLELKRTLGPGGKLLKSEVVPALEREGRLGLPAHLQFDAGGAGLTGALRMYETLEQNDLGAGHAVRLDGEIITPAPGPTAPTCKAIAQINAEFERVLRDAGACAP